MALCARSEPELAYRETSASSSSCSNLDKLHDNPSSEAVQAQSIQNLKLVGGQSSKTFILSMCLKATKKADTNKEPVLVRRMRSEG